MPVAGGRNAEIMAGAANGRSPPAMAVEGQQNTLGMTAPRTFPLDDRKRQQGRCSLFASGRNWGARARISRGPSIQAHIGRCGQTLLPFKRSSILGAPVFRNRARTDRRRGTRRCPLPVSSSWASAITSGAYPIRVAGRDSRSETIQIHGGGPFCCARGRSTRGPPVPA